MKGNGRMIRGMGGDLNCIPMETFIQENFKTERHMVRVGISGYHKGKYMMESGRKAQGMGMGYGRKSTRKIRMVLGIHTLENGREGKLMDMECIPGVMVINMRESGGNA